MVGDTAADVVLLAPVGGAGGIGSLTSAFMRRSAFAPWRFVDSVRPRAVRGESFATRIAKHLVHDLIVRYRFVRMLRRHPGAVAWFAVAPGPGFKVRDLPLAVYAARRGHGVVLQLHGGRIEGFLGRTRIGRLLVRAGLRRVQVIIATNRSVEGAFLDAGFGPTCLLLPNPIELTTERWAGDLDGPILLVAAQWPEKGSRVILEALARLPGARLRMVGHCTPRNAREILAIARRLGVDDRVEVVGRLPLDAQVRDEMKRASVLVLPSASEGFPMSVLEAMALGVPVVATDVGAIPDMLGTGADRAGVLVPFSGERARPCDPEALRAAIASVRDDALFARRLSDNALDAVRRYSFDRIEPVMLEIARRARHGRLREPASTAHDDERRATLPADVPRR